MAISPEARSIAASMLLKEIGVQPCNDLEAVFWTDNQNNIEWVAGYTAFIGKTCQMHVIGFNKAYCPRKFLQGAFDYAFNFRSRDKVFGVVNSNNKESMEYTQRVGFKEATRFSKMHDDDGDLVVHEMDKANCRWIKGYKK
jgi:L-amino acid N-acyltransferase YncA